MRILKVVLLPLLLILTLIGIDKLHSPRPAFVHVLPATPGR
ncbi:hypothetical protein [Pseudomonas mandelii]|nr:hypothetical protein [Pseudomonas mandelii]